MRGISVLRPNSLFSIVLSTPITATLCGLMLCAPLWAQDTATRATTPSLPLIKNSLEESQLTTLRGNKHPLARPEFDLGTAQASLPMNRMLLVLKRSSDQEAALKKLLDDQQDKASPNYHKWLSPEQFGQQFGPTDSDLQTITTWLQSHGFDVGSTKGRTMLEFSGSAGQVQEAFHTSIHRYIVNGEQHWANANDPQIPRALTPAVSGVLTLHSFYKKPSLHWNQQAVPAQVLPGKKPQITFTQNGKLVHALAPADYRVIYNINPNLAGLGTIAVIGRSNLYNGGQDVSDFVWLFGGGSFSITLNGADPGDLGGGEEAEATLDSTWSTTLATNANVNLVVSASTDTTDGIDLSELFIVENNLAAIMTESFSACELFATDAQLAGARALAEQAAAQGITYVVSAGDNGAAGCDDPNFAPATDPISVNYLASTAFNVAVGGTTFNENGLDSKYWSNLPPISETAISYIPENVWNESSLSNGLWASSGGTSAGNIASGVGTTAGVPKPNWQAGLSSIPQDAVRDVPDVSLTSASHDPYLLCLEGSCVPNSQNQISVYFISGTSAAAPAFAGIMTLVDAANSQVTGNPRVGQANYVLYALAAKQSSYPSQCNGSSTTTTVNPACIFNDVTSGNNVVPGELGTNYQAGAGYDLATGLGSVNVANLVSQWNSITFNPTTTVLQLTPPPSGPIVHGIPLSFSVSVSPNSGTITPTGDVSLVASTGLMGASGLTLVGNYTLAHGTVASSTSDLPGGGPYMVTAYYSGDATYAPSTSSGAPVLVTAEPSTTTVSVLTSNQNGNPIPFTSGPFGSFVYLRADVAGQSGHGFATGTVTFSDSSGPMPGGATLPLNSQGNAATPNGILNFDTGTHAVSASYSGDNSFSASTSATPVSFTITPGFLASIASNASLVVISAPGGIGTSSITVFNSTNFNGTISLSCVGLPSGATCTFTPATIMAAGTPATTTASITVATKAATAMLSPRRRQPYLPAEWMMGLGLVSLVLFGGKRHRARLCFLLLVLGLLVTVPSCGGGGGGSRNHAPPPDLGTPTGVSNVVVTATSGSKVSQAGFTLVVQ